MCGCVYVCVCVCVCVCVGMHCVSMRLFTIYREFRQCVFVIMSKVFMPNMCVYLCVCLCLCVCVCVCVCT